MRFSKRCHGLSVQHRIDSVNACTHRRGAVCMRAKTCDVVREHRSDSVIAMVGVAWSSAPRVQRCPITRASQHSPESVEHGWRAGMPTIAAIQQDSAGKVSTKSGCNAKGSEIW